MTRTMNWEYAAKNTEYESKLYDILSRIRELPGAWLGKPSITRLFHFIGGYTIAVMQYEDYRLHFDRDFYEYIKKFFPSRRMLNWDGLILEGRTEEEAFLEFYRQLDAFRKEQAFNQDMD